MVWECWAEGVVVSDGGDVQTVWIAAQPALAGRGVGVLCGGGGGESWSRSGESMGGGAARDPGAAPSTRGHARYTEVA